MIDYLSRINGVPFCTDYNDLRTQRIPEPVYPTGIILLSLIMEDEKYKEEAYENAIPEFKRFNIIENHIRDVA